MIRLVPGIEALVSAVVSMQALLDEKLLDLMHKAYSVEAGAPDTASSGPPGVVLRGEERRLQLLLDVLDLHQPVVANDPTYVASFSSADVQRVRLDAVERLKRIQLDLAAMKSAR